MVNDKWNRIYLDGAKYKPLNELFLNLILSESEKLSGGKIKTAIDLGCGTGDSLIKLGRKGMDIVGVDVSSVALEQAKQALHEADLQAQLINSDLETFEAQDHFDLVLCKLVLAFIKNQQAFIEKIKKLMEDDSIFILMTPVLHEGINYSVEDKPGIAIDYKFVRNLLENNFSIVKELHHEYFGEKGDLVTFIIKKAV